ncbi:uncharacterized protein [Dysidea avara]|uniref:uncharacterized protein n=1 Tax=Dysidea avara TaxID=196820 RepID=UPI0033168620
MANNTADSLVRKGYLYYKMKKRIAPNHKFWVELHRETYNSPRELRFFLSEDKAGERSAMCESVALVNILEVCDKHQTISGKPVFQITSTKCKYQLWTDTKEEMTYWINALQQELFGLPIAKITYEFKVMVLDNSTAKKYNLAGRYTAKIEDVMFTLFSANGLIPTRFSIQISEIWRVKLAPMPNDSVHSSFVVIDVTGGGALLLMSDSSTDIARIVSHRRRLVQGSTQSETVGPSFSPPHYGSPAALKKMKTSPIPINNANKCKAYDSPLLRQYLEFTDSSVDMASTSPEPKTKRSQSTLTENGNKSPSNRFPNGCHTVAKSPKMITTPPTIKPKPVRRKTDESSCDNQGPLSVTRTQSYGAVETTDYQKTATISNRPPVPLPRSLQSLPKFTPHHNCSPEDTLQKLREHIFNSSGSDSEVNDAEEDQYYVIQSCDSNDKYLKVFSDEDSHNSDEEDYCYAYIDVSSRKCEEYYIGGDVLIQLRKQLTQNKYTSLKGSRSMDSILSHNTIS